MQRILTLVGFILLFAIGVAVLAGGAAGGGTYRAPGDPVMAVVLLGAIAATLMFTVMVGGGLAMAFNMLSKQVSAKFSAEERPRIEKWALAMLEQVLQAAPTQTLLRVIGYGETPPATPYVPPYSYKAASKQIETRNFVIGITLVIVFLFGYAAVAHGSSWLEAAQSFFAETIKLPGGEAEIPFWLIPVGSIFVLLGGIGAVGVGLAVWFYRTHQEKDKAAKLTGPVWPAAEIVAWEQKIKAAPQTFRQLAFLDQALIILNLGLVTILLGAIGVWITPGVAAVVAVDEAARPTPAAVAAGGGETAIAVPEEILKEFQALPQGNAAAGKEAFGKIIPPCTTCHNVETEATIIGPSLLGVGTRAATRKAGYPAEIYIYESITQPNTYVISGFQSPSQMPTNFKELLTPQEIADLIAYLMTLK